ncbi:MAG: DUF2156 domain-containing protein, partial [Solirubrobacterales bacterium]|nr:DUF2156 domain-containing protein [Solirubrobacterales bacterium]
DGPTAAGADGLAPPDDAARISALPAPAPIVDPPPGAEPARRPRSPRALAWLTAIIAALSILPTAPVFHVSLGFGDLLSRPSRAVTFVLSVAVGLGLLAVVRGISRGKRQAWAIAVALFAVAAVLHVLKGPDPIAFGVDAAMLVALIWFRADFRARSDPRSRTTAIAFVPLYLAAVFAFGFASLLFEQDRITPALGFGGMLKTVFGGLIGLDGPYTFRSELFGDFFETALLVLGIGGLAALLYLILRPLTQRRPPTEARRARAREIVRAHGSDTLAYFALRRDKNYFFSSDGRSLIAYVYVRGHAMVAADPIGPPQDIERTIDEFLAFCAERGWRVAFLAVREADAPLYRDRGMHSLYLGDEAILRCDQFTLEGVEMKAVRSAVRRVDRDHSFELLRESDAAPELVAELNEISAEWRDGAAERGFTMELGQEVEGSEEDFAIALARDGSGRVAGFLRFVPCYGDDPGYSLDLMRRRPDAANGLTEFLIANAALALGARGFKRLSLNFAAWGRLLDSAEDAGFWGRVERRLARGLNPFFQIQSLRDFNQKFDPEWLPRSLVIDDAADLPKVALLYTSVEGFTDLPLVGRMLTPPIRLAEDGERSRSEA